MTALLTVGNSEGSRQCDAKCYDATNPVCTCVCGGMNHGVGFKKAQENIQEYTKQLLEHIKKEHPGQKIIVENIQQELFKQ